MGSGEASRCRLMRLPVARQQIPKTRPADVRAVCLTVYLLPRPYPPSGGPASPLPVLRGWISHPRPFAIHCLDRRHYCGKVFVLATVAVPMASPVTTSSTRRFCCRPSADSFEATG